MSTSLQAIFGILLMTLGGLKTWLHMGALPVLSLPMCNGTVLNVPLTQGNFFEQAHCWGCYAFAAGAAVVLFSGYQALRERRSVAARTD